MLEVGVGQPLTPGTVDWGALEDAASKLASPLYHAVKQCQGTNLTTITNCLADKAPRQFVLVRASDYASGLPSEEGTDGEDGD